MKFVKALIFSMCVFGTAYGADIDNIVERIDTLFRSDYSEATVSMMITTPHWKRTLEMDVWSRGMDDTFITITSPKKDRGITTLRKGNEMWNYFPKIDKVIKVPPSMMMGSWMGSDFTNDDLVRESSLLDDYDASFVEDAALADSLIMISLVPREGTVSLWGEIRLLVRREDSMPLEQVYYDEHGAKIRVLTLSDIKELGGKRIPTVLTMISLIKDNNTTVIRYHDATFGEKVPDDTFTLRNLRKKQ
ncbi:MAG: outer membrane lipoprotein-sorting protein [Waddliaceae bacterium]|jgi:outer membrane lipoprotein-sorting protein|nr:outer membrane lipoprotein-sorting protein [Waddliaceae bacterium]MBT3579393.1 outer membrane lipoprotein-sorting protein [Waddliaceae bacterium]MBT4444805.1 outer membrane lipoprotein-sorting protein [Waddliaceae bacterium]MBT6928500.1 outer membrane lipoprotein-sorting protein [Waddliaceae bacterium]MBT7264344.1 outer membrane lipoprotein-sorting protein [Waddliaceae bacterium]